MIKQIMRAAALAAVAALCVGVVGGNVEVGIQLERPVLLDEVREQARGVALAAVVGVGAEAAELAPGVDIHALAAHGD